MCPTGGRPRSSFATSGTGPSSSPSIRSRRRPLGADRPEGLRALNAQRVDGPVPRRQQPAHAPHDPPAGADGVPRRRREADGWRHEWREQGARKEIPGERPSYRGESLIEVLITVSVVGLGRRRDHHHGGLDDATVGNQPRRVARRPDPRPLRRESDRGAVPACSSGSTPYVAAATSAIPATNLPDGITVGAPGTVAASATTSS